MSRAQTIWRRLEQLALRQSRPTHLIGLSVFRVLVGLNLLAEYLLVYGQRGYLFNNRGLIPYATYLTQLSHFSLYWFASRDWMFELIYHGSVAVVLLWT